MLALNFVLKLCRFLLQIFNLDVQLILIVHGLRFVLSKPELLTFNLLQLHPDLRLQQPDSGLPGPYFLL